MPSLDLRDIPVFVLNRAEDQQRKRFMAEQLDALGLEPQFINGVTCDPGHSGMALSHLKALRQKDLSPPFLILEDHCKILPQKFSCHYDLPPETDALYLGHSCFGLRDTAGEDSIRWGKRGKVKYAPYDNNFIRIFNMLSCHAIVYISEIYAKQAASATLQALLAFPTPVPTDILYAKMQEKHFVLAPREIGCYQSRQYGGFESATNISLSEMTAVTASPGRLL